MGLGGRIERLLAKLNPVDAEAERLEQHWKAMHAEQVSRFEKLADLIPDSHQQLIYDALMPFADRLANPQDNVGATYQDHPKFGGVRPPAVVRWVSDLMHDFGAMPDPVPAELIDALLANPAAEMSGFGCRGCGVRLPGRPGRVLGPRPDGGGNVWTKNRPCFASCPCCGEPTPQDHPQSGHVDDPLDALPAEEPVA